MTNALVDALAHEVCRYFNDLKTGGVECRLVIPALTEHIATALHGRLLTIGMPSYLVVPHSHAPDEVNRWIRAEGLTSKRQGDMVVVVWPGEMSRIQDSVVGAGGAMRNFAFNDEWPWIDKGNEHFRFDGPVLDKLLDCWQISREEREAFKVVLQTARDASRDSIARGEVFLDAILGGFNPSEPAAISSGLPRLFFHLGIPYSDNVDWEDLDALRLHFDSVRNVLKSLRQRVEAVDGAQELESRARDIADDEAGALRRESSLKDILGTYLTLDARRQDGVLGLYGCWPDTRAWLDWNLEELRSLLDLPPPDERVRLSASISTIAGISAESGRAALLLEHGDLLLNIQYEGLDSTANQASLFVFNRSNPVFSQPCVNSCDTVQTSIAYETIFPPGSSTKKKSLRVVIRRGDSDLAVVRLNVYPCGTNQPLVVVAQPTFQVFSGHAAISAPMETGDAFEKIESDEPLQFFVAAWEGLEGVEAEIDGEVEALVSLGDSTMLWRLAKPIDAAASGSGRVEFSVQASGFEVALAIEAQEISRGEFTLERELVTQLAGFDGQSRQRSAITKIVDVFLGKSSTSYGGLSPMDDNSRARANLAFIFEHDDAGRPILANLLSAEARRFDETISPLAICGIGQLPPTFAVSTLTPRAKELVDSYTLARQAVISLIRTSLRNTGWPDYAFLPVFVESRRTDLEDCICAYVRAYLNALEYLDREPVSRDWAELFRLSWSDCVLHWEEGTIESRKIALIGPWHPLVVAKRFMVQAALVPFARRQLAHGDGARGGGLARLLDRVDAFRWFAGPSEDGRTFESYYISSTADPGWHVAISHELIGRQEYSHILSAMRDNFGLETTLVSVSREQVARRYLQDFFKAYPTRRAISVVADASYPPERLAESAEALLYEGETVTPLGRQLPGGIHIVAPNAESMERRRWRTPPVALYGSSESSVKSYRDINLISPGRAVSARAGSDHPRLPRGSGLLASFICPIRRTQKNADGFLVSKAFERDFGECEDSSLGGTFTAASGVLARMPNEARVVDWRAELPRSLDFLWTVVPGNHVDPAVFVNYVGSSAEGGEGAALWDYNMSLTGSYNSYFVLSKIPKSVIFELNRSPVFEKKNVAKDILSELGHIGIAIGSESLRSGTKALGVVGVLAATRLFAPERPLPAPLRGGHNLRGFLLPVDSFQEILGGGLNDIDHASNQRADLLAVQLGLLRDGTLGISFCAIECKYCSNGFSTQFVESALQQAQVTHDRFAALINRARGKDGIPERLAILSLISFGLRLSHDHTSANGGADIDFEGHILKHLIDGKFVSIPANAGTVAIVTDCASQKASWSQKKGLLVTVTPGDWPGISESNALLSVRQHLSRLFSTLFNNVTPLAEASSSKLAEQEEPEHEETEGQALTPDELLRDTKTDLIQPGETKGLHDDNFFSRISQPPIETPLTSTLKPILLGRTASVSHYYNPQDVQTPLDNYNMMVTGSSGKGKTQYVKMLVSRLRDQGRSAFLLDFKNDFASDDHFVARAQLRPLHVVFDGLPFNPLIPMPIRRPGATVEHIQISEHINGLSDILKKAFGLGDQQEVAVKNAIRECFEDRGIQSRGTVQVVGNLDYPDFNDVGEKLRVMNPAAYNRLDPLFDLAIFPQEARMARFDAMLADPVIVDLSQIQSDRIKNAIAKILIMSAHRYYNARPHTGSLRQFFVFDEAHRVLDSDFLLQFVRECRAYGVGVLLSSQYPTDFPQDVSASLNTKIIHGNGADRDRVRDISRLIGGSIEDGRIEELTLFEAIITNAQYAPTIIKTIGYPMMLALDAIQQRPGTPLERLEVPGVDATRLNIPYLVTTLMNMGLVINKPDGLYPA
ncbi:ATP-binding protein [Cupriavidus sp. USMAA2-4]|uniref:ATP-binding protein n=1 Tax=Cupriavidus sp. USMAA2-4 TaxID=876364 RepID=UPI000A479817|nr:DUF853 family protein [Cupriavidus sp. USMAA2-4]